MQDIQTQINDINRKLDIVLEEIQSQKQRREKIDDLVSDLSIVGHDAFHAVVETLDKASVELDTDALLQLSMKMIRNIDMLNNLFNMLEAANDLLMESGPIVKQVGIDTIEKMHELDQKGYFDFFQETVKIFDNIVTNFTPEDVRMLADNIVVILNTVKNMTQPEMLNAMNNAVAIYQHVETEDIPEYSLWKAFREMQTPEMKKGIGFVITFLKNLNKE